MRQHLIVIISSYYPNHVLSILHQECRRRLYCKCTDKQTYRCVPCVVRCRYGSVHAEVPAAVHIVRSRQPSIHHATTRERMDPSVKHRFRETKQKGGYYCSWYSIILFPCETHPGRPKVGLSLCLCIINHSWNARSTINVHGY